MCVWGCIVRLLDGCLCIILHPPFATLPSGVVQRAAATRKHMLAELLFKFCSNKTFGRERVCVCACLKLRC